MNITDFKKKKKKVSTKINLRKVYSSAMKIQPSVVTIYSIVNGLTSLFNVILRLNQNFDCQIFTYTQINHFSLTL